MSRGDSQNIPANLAKRRNSSFATPGFTIVVFTKGAERTAVQVSVICFRHLIRIYNFLEHEYESNFKRIAVYCVSSRHAGRHGGSSRSICGEFARTSWQF